VTNSLGLWWDDGSLQSTCTLANLVQKVFKNEITSLTPYSVATVHTVPFTVVNGQMGCRNEIVYSSLYVDYVITLTVVLLTNCHSLVAPRRCAMYVVCPPTATNPLLLCMHCPCSGTELPDTEYPHLR